MHSWKKHQVVLHILNAGKDVEINNLYVMAVDITLPILYNGTEKIGYLEENFYVYLKFLFTRASKILGRFFVSAIVEEKVAFLGSSDFFVL